MKKHQLSRRIINALAILVDSRDNYIVNRWMHSQEKRWKVDCDYKEGILFSILVPTYNTPKLYLNEMVLSVLNQTYANWELILADDGSTRQGMKKDLERIAKLDKRIRITYLRKNQQISAATNKALEKARGDFVVLLDHDDVLHARALESVAVELKKFPSAKFLYTDEAKIDDNYKIHQPLLKPKWNHDLLRSVNYITHMAIIRREIMKKIGGENSKYDGSQDWDLFIRVAQNVAKDDIIHIPKVLYYWRVHQQSTAGNFEVKPYVLEAQKNTLLDNLNPRNTNTTIVQDKKNIGQWYEKRADIKDPKIGWCMCGDAYTLDMEKVDYIVFVKNKCNINKISNLEFFAAEASREDIGMVVPYIRDTRTVINNLRGILPKESVELIKKLSWRSVSRHIYTTTKYNLTELDAPVAIVEVKKIKKVINSNNINIINIRDLSKKLIMIGYRNEYNPHIRIE